MLCVRHCFRTLDSCCCMQEQHEQGCPQPSLTVHETEHGGSVRAEAPEEALTIELLEQVTASCMYSRKFMLFQLLTRTCTRARCVMPYLSVCTQITATNVLDCTMCTVSALHGTAEDTERSRWITEGNTGGSSEGDTAQRQKGQESS